MKVKKNTEKSLKEILLERNADGDGDKGTAHGGIVRDAPEMSAAEYNELCKSSKLSPESEMETKGEDAVLIKDRILTFKGSDETIDRYGSVVEVDGWDLKNYKTNPVFLLHHDQRSVPVGRTIKVWKAKGIANSPGGKALMFKVYFPPASVSEESDAAFRLFKAQILNATSVGFMPKTWEYAHSDEAAAELGVGKHGARFMKQELWELSGVSVPANPAALQQNSAEGKEAREAFKVVAKSLGMGDAEISEPSTEPNGTDEEENLLLDADSAQTTQKALDTAIEALSSLVKLAEEFGVIVQSIKDDQAQEEKGNLSQDANDDNPEVDESGEVKSLSVYDLLMASLAGEKSLKQPSSKES